MEAQRIFLEGVSLDQLAEAVALKISHSLPAPIPDRPEVLNVEEAAGLIGLSIPSVWRLKASGELPYKKIGNGRVVFMRSELMEWLKAK